MNSDPEIDAMSDVQEILGGLEDDAAKRVVRWAADKYGVSVGSEAGSSRGSRRGGEQSAPATVHDFETFAEFFHAAGPETEADKVLVTGYWFHEREGKDELTSRTINDRLKDLGYPISNITREVRRLMNKKPALAVQLRKKGSSRQAHKVYKLTHAGRKQVEQMLGEGPQ